MFAVATRRAVEMLLRADRGGDEEHRRWVMEALEKGPRSGVALIRICKVPRYLGIARSTFYRRLANGTYRLNVVRHGSRTVGVRTEELDGLVAGRARQLRLKPRQECRDTVNTSGATGGPGAPAPANPPAAPPDANGEAGARAPEPQ